MSDCKYCDEEFSSEKEKIEHELDEHGEEMSSHDKDDKKSRLNKLEQREQTSKHRRKKQLQFGAIGLLFVGLVAGGDSTPSKTPTHLAQYRTETNLQA